MNAAPVFLLPPNRRGPAQLAADALAVAFGRNKLSKLKQANLKASTGLRQVSAALPELFSKSASAVADQFARRLAVLLRRGLGQLGPVVAS